MCNFDKESVCYALACYSKEECKARDKNGNINYSKTQISYCPENE